MNVMTIDILDHNELNERHLYKKVFKYTLIVSIIIILNIIILFTVRKKVYYQNSLYILKDRIVTNINTNELNVLTSNDTFFINGKQIKYEVLEIELMNESIPFYKVYLKLNGEYKKSTIIDYKILLRDDNLFNYLAYLIGGTSEENK